MHLLRNCSLLMIALLAASTSLDAGPLELRKGDHVCLVGNALGERMQHHNWWETLLHQQYGDKELAVRNLCFPGDEPYLRIRSKNFGSPDEHLSHSKASVVLYFFGFNESFDGEAGLPEFRQQMHALVEHTLAQDYSGEGAPRIVLVSPIAFENTGDRNLPDGSEHNPRLEAYTAALQEVAEKTGVSFVDLFHPTKQLFETSDERLTLNGAHLNDDGYRALAPIFMEALFGETGDRFNDQLRAEIEDKNFHWWHRYRAVNGFSIYGDRGKAGSDGTYNNTDVMERERAILDQMTANRDRRIWKIAQGETVAAEVDDSNTLPFLNPKTNVGGDNDPNRKRGKLGSLDYLSSEEQKELFIMAPGYEINLVASEEQFPELANPVALNFDNKGRLWVATMQSYPHWKPKTELNDKILIFEDHDQDGKADECKVFADGLHQPTGFEIGRNGAYIAQQPDILYVQDTDGDDKADTRVRQLVGFCSADSHHGISAFEWGPGGNLYFEEGTFKYSQIESPYGLSRLQEAGVWHYDPRTEKFGVHAAFSFANPWGHVFDRWGQNFFGDASPGMCYWAAPITGYIEYPMKHPGGQHHGRIAGYSGGDPNYRFPRFYPKRTRPLAGCAMISSSHFPPEAQGNYLVTNCIGDRAVLNHEVRETGSGFTGKEVTPIVECKDGNFRPVDVQMAPDGSLYIVDWHNALIGHLQHNLRDPSRDHSHGRIWRVTYKGRPLVEPAKIAGEPIPHLLDLLKLPEDRTRYRARRELAERNTEEVVRELDQWLDNLDPSDPEFAHHQLEGLWILQTHNVVRTDRLQQVLNSDDHRARAAGMRVLSFWIDQVPEALNLLQQGVNDEHPRVRLEAVRALSFYTPTPQRLEALEIALDVLNHETDEYLEYCLNETIRVLELPDGEPEVIKPAPEQMTMPGNEASELAAHDHAAHAGHGHEHRGHNHEQAGSVKADGPAPVVFLEKSPRVIDFQLARLDNSRLLNVERNADNAKFAAVYAAILTRAGISPKDRQDAVAALEKLQNKDAVEVLLSALESVDDTKQQGRRVARQLASMLLRNHADQLKSHGEQLKQATTAEQSTLRSVAYAGLIVADKNDLAWELAEANKNGRLDWLHAVSLIPNLELRNSLRSRIVGLLDGNQPNDVRQAAISSLASIKSDQSETFSLVAPFVSRGPFRNAAVRTLLTIPQEQRPQTAATQLTEVLVKHAENTPAAKRTTDDFIDAMQLADQLFASIPADQARSLRNRLREVTVRVVRIRTVEEEMRYDIPYFAVEAGRPVQIVLENEDLMPHNLVITEHGALREVAEEGAEVGPKGVGKGYPYVPKSKKVLEATDMVQPGQQYRLTFTAPREPGEYPYVCTFPRHWMRMYGVMVVVPDLNEWAQNPVEPKDPIGSNRSFVQAWKVDDFADQLPQSLENRSQEIGERLFTEATCALCHKTRGQGGNVGPALDEVFTRWKGNPNDVLQEILDPSHRIEEKYAMQLIVKTSGQVVSGIIVKQDAGSISILENPEAKQPTVIKRADIEEMVKTSTSIMPKALLDKYSQDEVLEILAYLKSLAPEKKSEK